jgi:protein involved in polysaccharide export with SLBB domain
MFRNTKYERSIATLAIMSSAGAGRLAATSAADPIPTATMKAGKVASRRYLQVALCVLSVVAGSTAASGIANSQTSPVTLATNPSTYTLGALDKIRLKVLEWRPSRNEIYEWQALNDAYTIGPTGRLSLPLIGEVVATGTTTEDLASRIGQQLRIRMGLASVPDVAVEIVDYRPFYIVGDAENPGGYAGRPNLSVLQAVSLAGGLYRKQDRSLRIGRELIAGGGQLELLKQEEITLIARKARLEAELKGEPSIAFPDGFGADSVAAAAMRLETTIFEARRQVRDNQMTALTELGAFLADEAKSIQERMAQHGKNVALAREELTSVRQLMERQLTTEPRRLAAQRAIFLLEGDGLRLASDLNRARKDAAANQAAMLELSSRDASEITNELLATQRRLTSVSQDKLTNGQLIMEAASISPPSQSALAVRYSIVRTRSGAAPIEFEAAEHTIVEPGDTIKVDATRLLDAHHLLARMPAKTRKGGSDIGNSDN